MREFGIGKLNIYKYIYIYMYAGSQLLSVSLKHYACRHRCKLQDATVGTAGSTLHKINDYIGNSSAACDALCAKYKTISSKKLVCYG
jgi:hypothetical protein